MTTWPPWGFKNVGHGKKQKAKINHFRKTAFIYDRFILFTFDNDIIHYQ